MRITARERKIMLYLLHKEGTVTVGDLAEELDVSERTVHRDLKGVEKILFHHNLELEKKAGVGLRIVGDQLDKQQLEQKLSYTVLKDFTQEERQAFILTILLEAKEPVKLIALANELDVSVATISSDLDELEEELSNFHLRLIRKKGYGIEIEGEEANKRSAITHLITKYLDPFALTSLLKENIQNKSVPTISNRLLGLVNPENLQAIEDTVRKASKQLPYKFADSAYAGLVVHLALAMERIKKGEAIEFDQKFFEKIKNTNEFLIAEKMIRELRKVLNLNIPEDEIGYITMHLLGAKLRDDQGFLLEVESSEIMYRVKQLIDYVDGQISLDREWTSNLLNDLLIHLKPAIYRIRNKMQITNPLLGQIKSDYKDLFDLIAEAVEKIFPELKFPEEEIAYLVLHFAASFFKDKSLKALVICSSGIGTAKMLATRLTEQVPEITSIENKSLFDFDENSLDHYDLIISTVPLKGADPSSYILTSPILNESEVRRIKKAIRKKKVIVKKEQKTSNLAAFEQLQSMKQYTDAILDLLQSFYVEEVSTTEAVLDNISMDLEKRKTIRNRENILQRLQERENVGGLGIPYTDLVLYHTRSNDVYSLHFSIYSLKNAITVKGMDGENMEVSTVLMMLAPETTSQEGLEIISYLSSLIIQDIKIVSLFESADEEAIKQYLAERFRTFLKEKEIL